MLKLISVIFILLAQGVWAVNPGDQAPGFTLENQQGEKVSLKDFKGKFVVLEWYNHGCPYVRKHYDSGNMQATQKTYQENDEVVWLTIVSSAVGKQGHLEDAKMAQKQYLADKMASSHFLRDPSGDVGRAYAAKTTPHMYIIDPDMKLAYVGAIDSDDSYKPESIKGAKNYITSSLSKLMLKEKPDPAKTKAYGCGVKY